MSVSQIYMFVNSFIFSILVCERNLKGYGRRVRRTVVIMIQQDLMPRRQTESYNSTEGYDHHPRFTSWSRGCKISWPRGKLNLILRRRVTMITRDLRRYQEAARFHDPEANWILYYIGECFIDLETSCSQNYRMTFCENACGNIWVSIWVLTCRPDLKLQMRHPD